MISTSYIHIALHFCPLDVQYSRSSLKPVVLSRACKGGAGKNAHRRRGPDKGFNVGIFGAILHSGVKLGIKTMIADSSDSARIQKGMHLEPQHCHHQTQDLPR